MQHNSHFNQTSKKSCATTAAATEFASDCLCFIKTFRLRPVNILRERESGGEKGGGVDCGFDKAN